MPIPTILLIHGGDRRWRDAGTLERALEAALRSGLQRSGTPFWDSVPVRLADYGGAWRDFDPTDDIAPIQAEFATDLLERVGGPGIAVEGWSMWGGLDRLVKAIDERARIDDQAALALFLTDLAEYFRDGDSRAEANRVVAAEAGKADGEVILLGHGVGSIVSYLALHEQRAALERVRGFVTFGSPLGTPAVRTRIEAVVHGAPFPDAPQRWINLFRAGDFAATVPLLAPLFRARDGRQIEDAPAADEAEPPAGEQRAHDALAYLSTGSFGSKLGELVEHVAAESATTATSGPPSTTRRSAQGSAERPPIQPPPAEPDVDQEEASTTRSWPGAEAEPAGAAPPWLDGAAPPWIDEPEDEDK